MILPRQKIGVSGLFSFFRVYIRHKKTRCIEEEVAFALKLAETGPASVSSAEKEGEGKLRNHQIVNVLHRK